MKYLVTVLEGKEVIFVFPRDVDHDRMAEALEAIRFGTSRAWERKLRESEIIAAGFVDSGGHCYGKSETLGIGSRGAADTALLKEEMDVDSPTVARAVTGSNGWPEITHYEKQYFEQQEKEFGTVALYGAR